MLLIGTRPGSSGRPAPTRGSRAAAAGKSGSSRSWSRHVGRRYAGGAGGELAL